MKRTLLTVTLIVVLAGVPDSVRSASNGVIAYPLWDANGSQNIFYINENGTGQVQATFGCCNGLPSWAPSGGRLAFVHVVPQTGTQYVYAMNSDGSNQNKLAGGTTPMWSPDAKTIAFTSSMTGTAEIWLMNPNGTNQRRLTNSPGYSKFHPVWSADSKSIVYAQYDSTGQHVSLWMIGVKGTNPHQITTGIWNNYDCNGKFINTANDANSPDWSIVTGQIVFWSGVEGQQGQIWVMNPDGTNRVQLTCNPYPSHNDDPEWSPDGTKILYTSDVTGGPVMWEMKSDGTSEQSITNDNIYPLPADPSWQPGP